MPANTITINVRRRLLRLHTANRRRRITGYVKEAVARFAKADIEKIKIDSALNKHLIAHVVRKPTSFKVSVEKLENRVEVKLPGAPKPDASKVGGKEKAATPGAKKEETKGKKPQQGSKA